MSKAKKRTKRNRAILKKAGKPKLYPAMRQDCGPYVRIVGGGLPSLGKRNG